MQVRCGCCDLVFRNVNERRKHVFIEVERNEVACTSWEVLEKRRIGKITHHYQVLRQLEKQQRPRKHGEAHDTR